MRQRTVIFTMVISLLLVHTAHAQVTQYDLLFSSVTGGGGDGGNEFYSVEFTLAQPFQGEGSSPEFTSSSGFLTSVNLNELVVVALDIKPQGCRNPLSTKSRGFLSVAILGTSDFDVTRVDPTSVRLMGVGPRGSSLEDVATPFEPFIGRQAASDCTDQGPDGFLDLAMKFDQRAVLRALEGALGRPVQVGEVLDLRLTGNLKTEFGGTRIYGEDVVVIVN